MKPRLAELQTHSSQPQRVGDHRHGTETHRGARDYWTQQHAEYGIENARGDRYPEYVVEKRKEKILPDERVV
jgi:hypothetical protein